MKKCKQDYIFKNLEDEIKRSGLKLKFIANYLGMHVITLNNKRIGYIRFKYEEKEKIKNLLRYEGTIEELFKSDYDTSKPKPKNKMT